MGMFLSEIESLWLLNAKHVLLEEWVTFPHQETEFISFSHCLIVVFFTFNQMFMSGIYSEEVLFACDLYGKAVMVLQHTYHFLNMYLMLIIHKDACVFFARRRKRILTAARNQQEWRLLCREMGMSIQME